MGDQVGIHPADHSRICIGDLVQVVVLSIPSSTKTVKMGIGRKMRESIQEVSEAIQVL